MQVVVWRIPGKYLVTTPAFRIASETTASPLPHIYTFHQLWRYMMDYINYRDDGTMLWWSTV